MEVFGWLGYEERIMRVGVYLLMNGGGRTRYTILNNGRTLAKIPLTVHTSCSASLGAIEYTKRSLYSCHK